MHSLNRREFMSLSGQTLAVAAASRFYVVESHTRDTTGKYASCFGPLDSFVEQYMRAMNAPGMTLVMADRDGVQRVATYGFSDLDEKVTVNADQLFEIGSISKSFVANCILQLHQEGKVELQKPVSEYLPWFRVDSSFAPITVHHLLTHSAGLPDDGPLFPADPNAKYRAAYAPGEHFHYCNMGYTALGHLVWTLDGQMLADVFRKRIFDPLGMSHTEPVITFDMRSRLAKNYMAFLGDRPFPRNGRLCEAPGLVMTEGAGCIAATPRDMGLYVQMIANHGKGPRSMLLSEESFQLFSKEHIKADEFGPTASYGYGIAVDTLDGHKIVRHTGGMVSFASALHVDIDSGVGSFASVNAMQGYRPNPVAQYAMQLMRAKLENKSIQVPALPESPAKIKNAADYVGKYNGSDGRNFEIEASGEDLVLVNQGNRTPLESAGKDSFVAPESDFARFRLVFGRADAKDAKSPVIDASCGGDWFANERYTGPKSFDYPKEWDQYVGHYRNDSPWLGSIRIVVCKGRLLADGTAPFEPAENGLFLSRESEYSPEWIRFADIVNGRAMRVIYSGESFWRVMAG